MALANFALAFVTCSVMNTSEKLNSRARNIDQIFSIHSSLVQLPLRFNLISLNWFCTDTVIMETYTKVDISVCRLSTINLETICDINNFHNASK